MTFSKYFQASSYSMVAVATLALVLAGGLHIGLALAFAAIIALAWTIEGKKWQLSERVGLLVVLLSIPLFFLDWNYQKGFADAHERLGVTALAHLIVFLSAVKLLQVKSDRDWVFIYLISFFEVLLAAGLSLSPVFLGTLTLYLLCSISTIVAFEIRKARRNIAPAETRLLLPHDARSFRKSKRLRSTSPEARRLPIVAIVLVTLIFVLALPLFLVAPRSGSAALSRGGTGLTNFVGFSETVTLGQIGTLKATNEIVMRVRVEPPPVKLNGEPRDIRWRGVALDEFTGKGWRKSALSPRFDTKSKDRGLFLVGTRSSVQRLTTQTIFLEPIESPVLFALTRPIAIQGDFPVIRADGEDSIQSRRQQFERIIYKAISDTSEPDPELLRADSHQYPASVARYVRLPEPIDPRIAELARQMIAKHHARNAYDAARAIETELQNNYGYSLEMKAGGADPLADFLFNVKAGHCEYFSTAMAVMLRTVGIPSRIVNGFLPGEYNEAAGAYTVRQSDAHSWVEVYFPQTEAWVTFDPTPAVGRMEPQRSGIAAQLGKYAEALELMWFQYVIGYDKQEQRSLATALQSRAFRYQHVIGNSLDRLKTVSWRNSLLVIAAIIIAIAVSILLVRLRRDSWRGPRWSKASQMPQRSAVEFYEALAEILAKRGIVRAPEQTPMEFANNSGVNEAVEVIGAYNRVRFGSQQLSRAEQEKIEEILRRLGTEEPA